MSTENIRNSHTLSEYLNTLNLSAKQIEIFDLFDTAVHWLPEFICDSNSEYYSMEYSQGLDFYIAKNPELFRCQIKQLADSYLQTGNSIFWIDTTFDLTPPRCRFYQLISKN